MQAKSIGWRKAGVAGLLFALIMSAWRYYDGTSGFDELAILFAVYFSVFTVGYRFLMNFFAQRQAQDD